MASTTDIVETIATLVDAWCDRRCLHALREILAGWPLTSGLTDDWGNLLEALERVRAFARGDLTEEEALTLEDLIHEIGDLVHRS